MTERLAVAAEITRRGPAGTSDRTIKQPTQEALASAIRRIDGDSFSQIRIVFEDDSLIVTFAEGHYGVLLCVNHQDATFYDLVGDAGAPGWAGFEPKDENDGPPRFWVTMEQAQQAGELFRTRDRRVLEELQFEEQK